MNSITTRLDLIPLHLDLVDAKLLLNANQEKETRESTCLPGRGLGVEGKLKASASVDCCEGATLRFPARLEPNST